jgi:hypothetical protein
MDITGSSEKPQFKLAPGALGYYVISVFHINKLIHFLGASSTGGAQVVQGNDDSSYNQNG